MFALTEAAWVICTILIRKFPNESEFATTVFTIKIRHNLFLHNITFERDGSNTFLCNIDSVVAEELRTAEQRIKIKIRSPGISRMSEQ